MYHKKLLNFCIDIKAHILKILECTFQDHESITTISNVIALLDEVVYMIEKHTPIEIFDDAELYALNRFE